MSASSFFSVPDRAALAVALTFSGPGALAAVDCTVSELNDDGTGGTVNTLSWAIMTANNGTTPSTPYPSGHPGGGCTNDTIALTTDVAVTGVMKRLIDSDLTLDGQNHTLSGGDTYRPLFIKSGTVTIRNLTLDNGQARGGDSRYGGGGAGLGGALFVHDGTVTVTNVTFSDNTATGGQGNGSGFVTGGGGLFGSSAGRGGGGLFGEGVGNDGGYGGTGAYGGSGGLGGTSSLGDDGDDGGFGGGGGGGTGSIGIGFGDGGDGGFGGGGGGGFGGSGGDGGFGGGGGLGGGLGRGGFGGGGGYRGDGGFGGGDGRGGGGGDYFGGGGAGFGGALFIKRGMLTLQDVRFSGNSAVGGSGYRNGQGRGGAIFVCTSDLDSDNTAKGAQGGCSAGIDEANSCGVRFDGGVAAEGQADLFWTGASGGTHDTAGVTNICPVMGVMGRGVAIADGAAAPSASDDTDWGGITLGHNASHVFTIQNTGILALNLTGTPLVALSGAGCAPFSVTVQPVTPVATTTGGTAFQVQYTPSSVTASTCTVSIANDDAAHNPYTFTIAGTGLKVATTTGLSSTPNPSTFGQSVTFTATVDPSTATGAVGFKDNGISLDGCVSQPLSGGIATCTTTAFSGGGHPITADYHGDTHHQSGTGTLQQIVQNSVTRPSATGQGDVTATFSGGGDGCNLTQAAFVTPSSGTPPAGYTFPYGLLRFTLGSICDSSAVTIQIIYPAALPTGMKYWKYGRTADNPTAHWYELPAILAGNTATFSLTDGGMGDDDLIVDGSITDDGGVGIPRGAGLSTANIPTLSAWIMLLLTGVLGLLGARRLGKIQKKMGSI